MTTATQIKFRIFDGASPALTRLRDVLTRGDLKRAVGAALVRKVRAHLLALPPNKNNWPSTHFYRACARGTDWVETRDGVRVEIDHPEKPGAFRQRVKGGTITMDDKLLTIPARAEFYGKGARQFTNLRFVMFASGTKALVVGKGGTLRQGRSKRGTFTKGTYVRGAGSKSAGVVAYWLKEEVYQNPDPSVLPTDEQMAVVAEDAVDARVRQALNERGNS